MSQLAITNYLNELSDLQKASGSKRESVVREAFKDLLKAMGKAHDLVFIPEHHIETAAKTNIYVDGALVYDLRLPFGYWEAKDQEDDLDKEIQKKLLKGYPQDNIIFEDSSTAVLIQNKNEVIRCSVTDTAGLEKLLGLFFGYQRPEIGEFRKAVAQFKTDLPAVLQRLREMIETADHDNAAFRAAEIKFLEHSRETINPAISAEDIREMLIQHILTEEIFSKVFDEDDFHRQNNMAKELYALEGLFFTGALKKNTLKGLEPYYNAIRTTAHQISTHTEKQTFLKVIYEGFYKVYNKKAADRLGVVYTPQEIVRFMVESADWLCQKHFGKSLIDKGVEILDPATGTGTFICELLEHFRGQKEKLAYKYKEELHANEVAILPYYVANLNIEATYAAINGYEEFRNLCFVDTLDNTAALRGYRGQQGDLFGAVSEENVARIKRQNKKQISVIIGNPPYNANQLNENENNKNREYPGIDKIIRETYVAASEAQKTKLYDMYVRFFRWASDRVNENGIVGFVSNSSFVHKPSFDGFRKTVVKEFNEIWIIDLKGDARTSGERRKREGGNIFGDSIKVGIAISFLIKQSGAAGCRILFAAARDYADADEKSDLLHSAGINDLDFEELKPDKSGNWVAVAGNDFETFSPIASKETKSVEIASQERAIFRLYSLGISTNRDEWLYDRNSHKLEGKIKYLIQEYDRVNATASEFPTHIKWSETLKRRKRAEIIEKFDRRLIRKAAYRPFFNLYLYQSSMLIDRPGHAEDLFPASGKNTAICFSDIGSRTDYCLLAIDGIADLHFGAAVDGYQQVARYRFVNGVRLDNITDWAIGQFREFYDERTSSRLVGADSTLRARGGSTPEKAAPAKRAGPRARGGIVDRSSPTFFARGEEGGRGVDPISPNFVPFWKKGVGPITKDAIFHYVYAVLHDPIYREKYAQNLKREFPRIPFYPDFWRWADWGERLMALHIGYETAEPWPLARLDTPDTKASAAGLKPKAMLKADTEHGIIVLDSETQLSGVPREAWTYRLGNRSALEWILDQHKEKTPKDPTIREKFNTYRFADYKEKVIDLLMRVTRVSVETMAIVEAMRAATR